MLRLYFNIARNVQRYYVVRYGYHKKIGKTVTQGIVPTHKSGSLGKLGLQLSIYLARKAEFGGRIRKEEAKRFIDDNFGCR